MPKPAHSLETWAKSRLAEENLKSQLVHLPFWHSSYIYRPRTVLRHFMRGKEKNVIIDGYRNGILKGELAIRHKDKVWVNSIVSAVSTILFLLLGLGWHQAFLLVALFGALVTAGSAYVRWLRRMNSKTNRVTTSQNNRSRRLRSRNQKIEVSIA